MMMKNILYSGELVTGGFVLGHTLTTDEHVAYIINDQDHYEVEPHSVRLVCATMQGVDEEVIGVKH